MELLYKEKKTEEEIIKKARLVAASPNVEGNASLLIKGEALEALSGLLDRFEEKIDLVYVDPPQNGFLSNGFDRAKVSDAAYAEFLRERLYIIKRLMSPRGSLYLELPSRDAFMIKCLCDEIFGAASFKNDIARVRSNPRNFAANSYGVQKDTILFYAKDPDMNIWNDIRLPPDENELSERFNKLDGLGRRYTTVPLHAPGETKSGATGEMWRGMCAPPGRHWMTSPDELDRLDDEGRIEWSQSGNPRLIVYASEYEGKRPQDVWTSFKDPLNPTFQGERNSEMLDLIVRQSSGRDSIVLDPFAGSGAFIRCADAEKRRWIAIETSSSAVDAMIASASRSFEYADLSSGYVKAFPKTETEQLSFFD